MPKLTVDADLIGKLADLMEEKALTELELAEGDHKLKLSRQQAGLAAPMPMVAPAAGPIPGGGDTGGGADKAAHPGAVPSPMVGTAYLAPQPGADNFVTPGDMVKEGQTLLIIEAMKVMNPIPAPKGGKVKEVLVTDGQPVEFGEPLVILE
ncbi:acetyl-CoA carboxylase biotin carboxyl carrier protein [Marivibrio halodurans]|uniref:Biotin carboxyl carrier protein of acetyl-CoA carboxylase n=1 Tax=Marivibrio halodurans TaxID=2039722 RepID=A0A8J7SIX5_9PROT|nr:acetyl-CoA carboxylase biotin carboxyl carrier protein [Marivibrio halodurans]MBP5857348.1 acetyl-CoA carboxylase biotin carboxyl carrier protein [Marivibrio halodurans]